MLYKGCEYLSQSIYDSKISPSKLSVSRDFITKTRCGWRFVEFNSAKITIDLALSLGLLHWNTDIQAKQSWRIWTSQLTISSQQTMAKNIAYMCMGFMVSSTRCHRTVQYEPKSLIPLNGQQLDKMKKYHCPPCRHPLIKDLLLIATSSWILSSWVMSSSVKIQH